MWIAECLKHHCLVHRNPQAPQDCSNRTIEQEHDNQQDQSFSEGEKCPQLVTIIRDRYQERVFAYMEDAEAEISCPDSLVVTACEEQFCRTTLAGQGQDYQSLKVIGLPLR